MNSNWEKISERWIKINKWVNLLNCFSDILIMIKSNISSAKSSKNKKKNKKVFEKIACLLTFEQFNYNKLLTFDLIVNFLKLLN